MTQVSIRFLGRFEAQSPSGEVCPLIGVKTVLLLARLTMPPGQAHDRKRLTELFWPDRGEAQASASLRQSLWILRKAFAEPSPIIAERTSIRLDEGAVAVDTLEFERQIRCGTIDSLERAVTLYRGDLLEEYDLDDEPGHQPLLFERRRLREMALSGLKTLAVLREEADELDGALEAAGRALSFDQLQEDVHALIIRLHCKTGRPGLARDQYESCRDILRRELGAAPSEEVEAVWKSLGTSPRPVLTTGIGRHALVNSRAQLAGQPWAIKRVSAPDGRLASLVLGIVGIASLILLFFFKTSGVGTAPDAPVAIPGDRPSVVVLPFKDLSADNEQSLFAESLTDHLINDLSTVSGLFVIAPETSRTLQNARLSGWKKAEALDTDYAVEGTVRYSPGSLHVTARLVLVETGRALWTDDHVGNAIEIFDVQDKIVQHIIASLGIEVSDRERRAITRTPTDDLEAYDYYQRAEHQNFGMAEPEALRSSLAAYRHATKLDAKFAEAYAGYARVAVTIWRRDFSDIMAGALAKDQAYIAAKIAQQLDPQNARAKEVLSIIRAVDGVPGLAESTAREAVALQPNDAEAHTNLANVLYLIGELDQAQAEVEIARTLNPALPTELRLVSAMVAFAQERYAESVAEFTEVSKSVPRSELVLEHLAAAYAYLGDKDKALATVTELRGILPITNLGFYAVLRKNVGTSDQISRFIEGLRRAGIPEWPYGDERRPEDRLGVDELRTVIKGPRWVGELKNGVSFVQEFEGRDGFGYSSSGSMLTGKVAVVGDQLCQVIEGYLLNRPSCGYVYRNASDRDHPVVPFVYVSIDAVKYFAVSD